MAAASWFKAVVLLPLALVVFYYVVTDNAGALFSFPIITLPLAIVATALAYDLFVGHWHEIHPSAPAAPPEAHGAPQGGHDEHGAPHGGGHGDAHGGGHDEHGGADAHGGGHH